MYKPLTIIFLLTFFIESNLIAQEEVLLPLEKQGLTVNEDVQSTLNESESWKMLYEKGWVAYWNETTKTPHRAWGKPLIIPGFNNISKENVSEAALVFLKHFQKSLSIRVDSLFQVRATNANGIWYVTYMQKYNGFPVFHSRVELRITSNAQVILLGVDYFNDIKLSKNSDLSLKELGYRNDIQIDPIKSQIGILPIIDQRTITYQKALKWENNEQKSISIIDVKSGEILSRKSTICKAFSGIATGDVQEVLATDIPQEFSFSDLYYSVNGEQFVTGENGEFEIENTVESTLNVNLEGPFVKITNASAQNANISETIESGQDVIIKWDDTNSSKSERNAFYHINLAHDTLKAIDPDYTYLDFSLPVIVDKTPANCNPYYDQNSINFDKEGSGCVSGADIAMVVYHEYAHAIIDKLMISLGFSIYQNRAADEAQADVFSTMIENSPLFAPGFFGPGTSTRNLSTFKSYPNDVDPNSPHLTGLILSGAFWDLKERTSPAFVNRLAHFAKYGAPDGFDVGTVFKDWFIEVLIVDDDDGYLGNGTPHFEDINWAFERHGISVSNIIDNTEANITSFSLAEQTSQASIDQEEHTVDIEVLHNTDVSNLIPSFSLSHGATAKIGTVDQKSGETANDFSNPVVYSITSEDNNTINDWTVTVTISNEEITGIKAYKNKMVNIYPNPMKDELQIIIEKMNLKSYSMRLISLLGVELVNDRIEDSHTYWDMSTLPNGIYFIQILYNDEIVHSSKLLKN